ncbi:hypothetical protein ACOSP7_031486 [Xanthoceras sorbifolium]
MRWTWQLNRLQDLCLLICLHFVEIFCQLLRRLGSLTFQQPDKVKYASMALAYAAGLAGGTMTGVLSATNEKAVEMFIGEKYVYYPLYYYLDKICF